MKVMRSRSNRRGFLSPSGAGVFYDNNPSPGQNRALYILVAIATLAYTFFVLLPDFLGMNLPPGISIVVRAVITLAGLPALWFFGAEKIPSSTKFLFSAEIILLLLEPIPGSIRILMLLHLIVFILLAVDTFIIKGNYDLINMRKLEFSPFLDLAIRLLVFPLITITAESSDYLVWILIISIIFGIGTAAALIIAKIGHPFLCALCALPASLFAFLGINCATLIVNYSLDNSEPVRHTALLEEIDYRTKTDFFYISINGKNLALAASDAQTYLHNEGDVLTVLEYDGALGIAYYMIEE